MHFQVITTWFWSLFVSYSKDCNEFWTEDVCNVSLTMEVLSRTSCSSVKDDWENKRTSLTARFHVFSPASSPVAFSEDAVVS